ncbi:MAG: glycoside hydrolase family 97 protein [Bacteroidota bacterium]
MLKFIGRAIPGFIILLISVISARAGVGAVPLRLESPDKNLLVEVSFGENITYTVTYKNTLVISPSVVGMKLDSGAYLGRNPEVESQRVHNVNTKVRTYFYKREELNNNYNELSIVFKGKYGMYFRAYNEGVAYRFFTRFKRNIKVLSEDANFNFASDASVLLPYPNDTSYYTSFESPYDTIQLSKPKTNRFAFLPVLAEQGGNIKTLITEADLFSYPGMFVKPNGKQGLKGVFAQEPVKFRYEADTKPGYDMLRPTARANYIAAANGERSFPWRVLVISDKDADLADNDLVYKLARPNKLGDVSWVKPGKAAWDWWNNWDITGVDFKAGINTATYKKYIDFASKNGLEYIIMDEGWSKTNLSIAEVNPEIGLNELLDYAKKHNVGIILWCTAYSLNKDMEANFKKYAKMGIKGFKVDFMNRDDRPMIDFQEQVLAEAARNKLVIDFHGVSKPTGLNRTYPNELSREGVFGMEHYKSTDKGNTDLDVQLAFIRMAAGSMDYTPGAMRNYTSGEFKPNYSHPGAKGTRCHQLAMYVAYETPLQVLSDCPANYEAEKDALEFISKVPTVWEESRVLDARLGEYVVIARRKGTVWYVGALNGSKAREVTIKTNFIRGGTKKVDFYEDGINADRNATDYKRRTFSADANGEIVLKLAAGGGSVFIVRPE